MSADDAVATYAFAYALTQGQDAWPETAGRHSAALAAVVERAKLDARDECDRDWADYFAGIGSHVGDPEFTQALVVKLLRGVRPFGCAAKATP